MTFLTFTWNYRSANSRNRREKLIKITHDKMSIRNIFWSLLHVGMEESWEKNVFAALSFLVNFRGNIFCHSIKEWKFFLLLKPLSLAFLIQLKACFDRLIFVDMLKYLFCRIEINFWEFLVWFWLFIKNNFIMRHVI